MKLKFVVCPVSFLIEAAANRKHNLLHVPDRVNPGATCQQVRGGSLSSISDMAEVKQNFSLAAGSPFL